MPFCNKSNSIGVGEVLPCIFKNPMHNCSSQGGREWGYLKSFKKNIFSNTNESTLRWRLFSKLM